MDELVRRADALQMLNRQQYASYRAEECRRALVALIAKFEMPDDALTKILVTAVEAIEAL